MIPKRIHYVWVGGELPRKQQRFVESWRQTNPDFEIVCWNERNIDMSVPLIAHAYRRRRWTAVADIVRLMAVAKHGGIYLDTDFRVYRPLDELLRHSCFFVFQHEHHPTDWVCNGVFGAEPGHWFVRRALEEIQRLRPMPFGLERPTRYGPKLVTRLLREHGLNRYDPDGIMLRDIFICPVPVFFPFAQHEPIDERRIGPATLAAHFWEKSWAKDLPLPLRLARRLKQAVAPS